MTARGFIRHRGGWRTPQEIELAEREERATIARAEWNARLKQLRKKLDDPATASAAAEQIRETVDPHAVPALAAALAAEPVEHVRSWYLESLSRIGSADSIRVLASTAIDHADRETRIVASEQLAERWASVAAPLVAAALADADNARLNRAAEVLGRLRDASSIGPLIAVLETNHVVTTGDGTPEGSTTATFTPSGNGGLSLGGNRQTKKITLRNSAVHEALVAITGVDFQWDVKAWRAWLAGRDLPADFDPRRD